MQLFTNIFIMQNYWENCKIYAYNLLQNANILT